MKVVIHFNNRNHTELTLDGFSLSTEESSKEVRVYKNSEGVVYQVVMANVMYIRHSENED